MTSPKIEMKFKRDQILNNMTDPKTLKKELGLKNKDIAEFFDMSEMAFANSSAKDRYISALNRFYEFLKNRKANGQKPINPLP